MENKKRLIPEAIADCFEEVTKIKTHFAKIIVEGTAEKPYYSILYYDPTKKEYYNGYGSYFIGNVFNWLSEWFEIVEDSTVDAVEVVRCKDCKICDFSYPAKPIGEEAIPGWYCKKYRCYRKPDDFCSYGERKDNG